MTSCYCYAEKHKLCLVLVKLSKQSRANLRFCVENFHELFNRKNEKIQINISHYFINFKFVHNTLEVNDFKTMEETYISRTTYFIWIFQDEHVK